MFELTQNKSELYGCYRKFKIDFYKQLCRELIPEKEDPLNKNYLECLKTEGSASYDEEFCKIKYAGEDKADERLACFDSKGIKSKEICDIKYKAEADEDPMSVGTQNLLTCYEKEAGLSLGKEFCDKFYDDLDERYLCYQQDSNLKMTKDSTYCELKNPTDYIAKYECLGTLDPPQKKGGEFCTRSFPMPEQYLEKDECLRSQDIKRDSNYCVSKYSYLKREVPEDYTQIDELMCLYDLSFPMRKDECELINSKIWSDYLGEVDIKRQEYLKKAVTEYRFDQEIEKQYVNGVVPLNPYYVREDDMRQFLEIGSTIKVYKDKKYYLTVVINLGKEDPTKRVEEILGF